MYNNKQSEVDKAADNQVVGNEKEQEKKEVEIEPLEVECEPMDIDMMELPEREEINATTYKEPSVDASEVCIYSVN